jgi:hypothetical protein
MDTKRYKRLVEFEDNYQIEHLPNRQVKNGAGTLLTLLIAMFKFLLEWYEEWVAHNRFLQGV